MNKPVRIQRKRTKGFNLQEYSRSINGLDAVIVDRTSKEFGNTYRVGSTNPLNGEPMTRDDAISWFASDIDLNIKHNKNFDLGEWLVPLEGKNIACTCKEGEACHGDILLELSLTLNALNEANKNA